MRSFVALSVTVLLVCSSVFGFGAVVPVSATETGTGADVADRVRAPTSSTPVSARPVSDSGTRAVDDGASSVRPSNVTVRDETEMHVSLRANGNARWNVTAWFGLRNRNETVAFRELAERYENGNGDVGFSVQTFERMIGYANTNIGRKMSIRKVDRSAQVGKNGSVGRLSLSFTWTNFTRVDGSRIVLGDVFWVGSETWLPSLNDDQTLVIEGPDAYIITGASPSGGTITSGNVLRYEGPQQFESGDFAVTYSPRSTTTTTTGTTTTTPTNDFPDLSGTSNLVFVLLLVGLGGVGAYVLIQRQDANPDRRDTGSVTETDDRDRRPSPSDEGDAGGDSDDEDVTSESDAEETDPELLSDEERVLRLLRENDGRMKQANIVSETNWSNAKVSQLLSKMADDGDVDKLRIGRENLITLPDENVTDVE